MAITLGFLFFLLSLIDFYLVQIGTIAVFAKTKFFADLYELKLQWTLPALLILINFASPAVIDNREAPFKTIFCTICLSIAFILTGMGIIVWRSGYATLSSFEVLNGEGYDSGTLLMTSVVITSLFLTGCPMLCWRLWNRSALDQQRGRM
jgi:hypothetical protein